MRRFFTFLVVAATTASATTWWLYEGDLAEAVEPVLPEWNADALALREGLAAPPPLAAPDTPDE